MRGFASRLRGDRWRRLTCALTRGCVWCRRVERPEFDIVEPSPIGSDPEILTVRFRERVEDEFILPLQFVMTSTSGLGNLSLPRLDPVQGRVTRRWLAVSVAPDVEYSPGVSPALRPLEAAEYLSAWGDAEAAPNLCYRLAADDPAWSLATRSRQPRTESKQRLDVSVSRTAIQLILAASLDTTNGLVFQHRLSVPRDFDVESVVVTSNGSAVAAQANHDGSGTMTIFLGQGVTGAHQLRIEGSVPVPDLAKEFTLPSVALVDTTVRGHTVSLYRRSDVLIDIGSLEDKVPVDRTSQGTYQETLGRLVAAVELDEAGIGKISGVVMAIRPNQPSVDARLVTRLQRANDKWEAIVDFDAQLSDQSDGVVDRFRFEIPAEWTGPFVVEPSLSCQTQPIPGQRRYLTVRPSQPVTDRFQVRIRGALELGSNERGRTPNIVPLDVANAERFFVLPTQLDQQIIDWKTSGLYKVQPRDALVAGLTDSSAQVAYRVWSKPRAVIADVQRVAGEKQISLADVHVACRQDGECFGVVTFEIEPAGSSSCTLEIPANFELVQVGIEGVPATLIPLADRRWHVRLVSEQLPQQLAVIFRGRLAAADARQQQLSVPWISDYDVVRTLWTVRGPPGALLRGADVQPHQVSAVRQEAMRLRNLASLIESAADTVLDSPATEVRAWYAPWAIRLACSDARIERDRWLTDRLDDDIDLGAVAAIDRQQEAIVRRLNITPRTEEIPRDTRAFPQASDLWEFNRQPATVASRYAFIGAAPTLTASLEYREARRWWTPIVAVVVAAVVGLLIRILVPRGMIVTWLCQWPYAAGVLVGLAWWLFASPGFLGWIIVVASLWGAIRIPVPNQTVARPATEPATEQSAA